MWHWPLCPSTSYKSICSLCWMKSNFYIILYQLLHSRLFIEIPRMSYQVFWEKGHSVHSNYSQITIVRKTNELFERFKWQEPLSLMRFVWSKSISFHGISFHFPFKKSWLFNFPSHMLLLLISKSVPFHCSCPGRCLCDSVGGVFRLRPCSGV